MAGLSRLKQFLWITAPLLLPAIGSAVVMTFIRVVGSFGTPAVLGMPVRYYVLPTQIYAAMGTRNAGDGFHLAVAVVGDADDGEDARRDEDGFARGSFAGKFVETEEVVQHA